MTSRRHRILAAEDFKRARQQAALQEVTARFTRKQTSLLSYEDVRQKLRAVEGSLARLQEIRIDAIVGSVGRYTDFTNTFLPKLDSDKDRWAGVMAATQDLRGLPPIDVYQVGEVYFVMDGNHRVSVARRLGAPTIQAYVTPVHTNVNLTTDDIQDDLIIKEELSSFLSKTSLDKHQPGIDWAITSPGRYLYILQQIEIFQFTLGMDKGEEVSYLEAVLHWCNEVYIPTIEVIRERNILRDFPGRTETDLFVWLVEHRVALKDELGWDVGMTTAATDLADQHSTRFDRAASRLRDNILDAITPEQLGSGPSTGLWQESQLARHQGRLFSNILVSIPGIQNRWDALSHGLEFSTNENAQVLGLHILPTGERYTQEERASLQDKFDNQCQAAGIEGRLVFDTGELTHKITERARFVDLVILSLYSPSNIKNNKWSNPAFRRLIQHCPVPVLAVRENTDPHSRILLAYDGSPKANEALFLATYFSAFWGLDLIVLTVLEKGHTSSDTMLIAQEYIESHGAQAEYLLTQGNVPEAILETANDYKSDLIILGSYSTIPLFGSLLGSTLDEIIRKSQLSILICR